jgi:hypothetical protein
MPTWLTPSLENKSDKPLAGPAFLMSYSQILSLCCTNIWQAGDAKADSEGVPKHLRLKDPSVRGAIKSPIAAAK